MTEQRNRRPGFHQDPFEALFDPKAWAQFEKKLTGGIEKAFRGIAIRKNDEVVAEATDTAPADVRHILVATLDVPGVAKEDVKITFSELDYGFTRLSVSTKRDGLESLFKVEFRETVVPENATAKVELGVLTIRVPLKEDDTKSKFDVPVS